jgi:hypothetical protein
MASRRLGLVLTAIPSQLIMAGLADFTANFISPGFSS